MALIRVLISNFRLNWTALLFFFYISKKKIAVPWKDHAMGEST